MPEIRGCSLVPRSSLVSASSTCLVRARPGGDEENLFSCRRLFTLLLKLGLSCARILPDRRIAHLPRTVCGVSSFPRELLVILIVSAKVFIKVFISACRPVQRRRSPGFRQHLRVFDRHLPSRMPTTILLQSRRPCVSSCSNLPRTDLAGRVRLLHSPEFSELAVTKKCRQPES